MSQGFKLRFDQMRENIPTDNNDASNDKMTDFYQAPGHTRNLCLSWPDGKRFFLNYAYLITGEFKPENEKNLITLDFSSVTVSLEGYSMESLFMALLDHMPRMINATDPRYVLEDDKADTIVFKIAVEKKEN